MNTAAGGSILLNGKELVSAKAVWDTGKTSITVAYEGLAWNKSYTVAVNGFKDVAGNAMAQKAEFTLKTGTAPVYPVQFYSDGVLVSTVQVEEGKTLASSMPVSPVKTGYTFEGWYTGENGTGTHVTGEFTITAGMKLYAKWSKNEEKPASSQAPSSSSSAAAADNGNGTAASSSKPAASKPATSKSTAASSASSAVSSTAPSSEAAASSSTSSKPASISSEQASETTISEKIPLAPATDNGGNVLLYGIVALVVLGAAGAGFVVIKKRKQ